MSDQNSNGMIDTAPDGRPAGAGAKTGHTRPAAAKLELAALLVASGRTLRETAAESGVAERTLRRWLATDADFIRKLREHRTSILAQAVGRLSAVGAKAAATLGALLDDESPAIRLRAAASVLANLVPGHRAVEERQAVDLAEKCLARSAELDAEWQELRAAQQRLEAEQARLDAQRQRPGGNGAASYGR